MIMVTRGLHNHFYLEVYYIPVTKNELLLTNYCRVPKFYTNSIQATWLYVRLLI